MRNTYKVLLMGIIAGLFIMRPVSSYADWNGHDGHGHDGDHHDGGGHGRSFIGVNLALWPDSYYYNAPYYLPPDQVLVSSPVYQPIVINGVTYYLNNGTYYVYNGYGYQAVPPPVSVIQPPVTVVQPPVVIDDQPQAAAVAEDSFTINIPNNKGGYTAVTLKKSGNGYIGPQGEFYPEFPKVSQLEAMYGK